MVMVEKSQDERSVFLKVSNAKAFMKRRQIWLDKQLIMGSSRKLEVRNDEDSEALNASV